MFFSRKVLRKTLALGTEHALRPLPIMGEKILHNLRLGAGGGQNLRSFFAQMQELEYRFDSLDQIRLHGLDKLREEWADSIRLEGR